ncbi:PREDICTED: cytochrome c oxidase subunit NDUFA4 [Thamnophis sirtalis]|uniref:Cytochrome c oxidase subunit NDUFA4 n=1 Tax=Thamnophis sirtalis TaxID=35019 RepID=A0A6I9Z2K0_9SAUR|nr:PREDICTED: cytochrome c oxidase subunit NDUFA4 [Thamnophis sirtalis]
MSQQQQPQQPRAPPAASAASNPGLIGFLRHQVTHRPSLIPLFLIMGTAVAGAGLYLMRLALLCPEVRWDKKNNPEPWNNLDPTHRYKFFAVNMDYSKLQKDRPDF